VPSSSASAEEAAALSEAASETADSATEDTASEEAEEATLEAELPQPAREVASRADTANRETKRVYFIALHLKNKIT
jgi:guanyl-specific ribonuclease Sa